MAARGQSVFNVYPVANYTFGTKGAILEKDASLELKLARYKASFEKEGLRQTVDGVLLVQEHNHPHVLLLHMGPGYFRLPGGKVRRGDDEVETLKRKMTKHLAPDNPALRVQWDVGEVLGCFHRPNFDTAFYPYVPPHITRPKESRKLFVVQLPERCVFAVPKNAKLVAVPLFDLYDNLPRYGPIISALPLLLSRLRLNLQFVLPPPPPQAPAMQGQGQTAAQQQGFQGQGHENGAGGGMAIQPYEGHYA